MLTTNAGNVNKSHTNAGNVVDEDFIKQKIQKKTFCDDLR